MKRSEKEQLLRKLNEAMDAICPCELKKTAKQAVPGAGNADARVMFVGEAPGAREDLEGKPFVGAAGKLLDRMLAEIGLDRDDVYITNVVKYRPPNNRDPLPAEVESCRPWLSEQIALIDPDLIVLLGRHSLEWFLPGKKISLSHGKAFRRFLSDEAGERIFFVLYHPAAALYNPSLRETLFADFAKIPRLLRKIESEENLSSGT